MKKTSLDKDHPGVAEVRRWRAAVVKKAGGTIEGLTQVDARNTARQGPRRIAEARWPHVSRRQAPRRDAADSQGARVMNSRIL